MDLCTALAMAGARDVHKAGLVEAERLIVLARDACIRDRHPLDWARANRIHGNVLVKLGDPNRLRRAAVAYGHALRVYRRADYPIDWALLQMNRGILDRRLGSPTGDRRVLRKAVAAHTVATECLEVHRASVPTLLALARMNLGNALVTLGERENGPQRYLEAIAAYRASLVDTHRETHPVDWAMRRSCLGNALWVLGVRENYPPLLKRSAAAIRPALKEFSRRNLLLDWIAAKINFGNSVRSLGKMTKSVPALECAVATYREALAEIPQKTMASVWGIAKDNLARGLAALADLTDQDYEPALAEIGEAIVVFQSEGAGHYLRKALNFRQRIATGH